MDDSNICIWYARKSVRSTRAKQERISSLPYKTGRTNVHMVTRLLALCICNMWELIFHYDFVLSDRSIANKASNPPPLSWTVKHAGLFAYERVVDGGKYLQIFQYTSYDYYYLMLSKNGYQKNHFESRKAVASTGKYKNEIAGSIEYWKLSIKIVPHHYVRT